MCPPMKETTNNSSTLWDIGWMKIKYKILQRTVTAKWRNIEMWHIKSIIASDSQKLHSSNKLQKKPLYSFVINVVVILAFSIICTKCHIFVASFVICWKQVEINDGLPVSSSMRQSKRRIFEILVWNSNKCASNFD